MQTSRLTVVLLIFLVSALPVAAWPQTSGTSVNPPAARTATEFSAPTHAEIVDAVSTAATAYAEFERVTNRIDFTGWNSPYGNQRSARGRLDSLRNRLDQDKATLAYLRTSQSAPASQLFLVLDDLLFISDDSGSLASDVLQFNSNPNLATDLTKTSTDAIDAATTLRGLFMRQLISEEERLASDEAQLRSCHTP